MTEVADNNFPDIDDRSSHYIGHMAPGLENLDQMDYLEGVEQMGYLVVEGRDRDHLGHIAPALEILDQMN